MSTIDDPSAALSVAIPVLGKQDFSGMAGLASVNGSSCDVAPCAVREARAQRGPRECRRVYSRAHWLHSWRLC
jgi:hypothetical protein